MIDGPDTAPLPAPCDGVEDGSLEMVAEGVGNADMEGVLVGSVEGDGAAVTVGGTTTPDDTDAEVDANADCCGVTATDGVISATGEREDEKLGMGVNGTEGLGDAVRLDPGDADDVGFGKIGKVMASDGADDAVADAEAEVDTEVDADADADADGCNVTATDGVISAAGGCEDRKLGMGVSDIDGLGDAVRLDPGDADDVGFGNIGTAMAPDGAGEAEAVAVVDGPTAVDREVLGVGVGDSAGDMEAATDALRDDDEFGVRDGETPMDREGVALALIGGNAAGGAIDERVAGGVGDTEADGDWDRDADGDIEVDGIAERGVEGV